MRTLAFSIFALLLAGCASVPPLSGAEIVELSRAGKTAPEIIAELQRTQTVLPLAVSDYVRLRDAGVPEEVLNYLQRAQLDEMLWQQYRTSTWSDMGAFGGWSYTVPGRGRR